ncbi:MAG: RNA-directed DNA polymerase [Eubacterium sp.]|nr:RNA-directed DNA polymerase [Eubacterium sp.]
MKTLKHQYEEAAKDEEIKNAIIKAAEHKHKRKDVQETLGNLDEETEIVKDMWLNHSYIPTPYTPHIVRDGSKNKTRCISKPKYRYDQIMAHVIVQRIKPMIMKSLYHHVYGSIEGRGQTQFKKAVERCIKRDAKGTKYCGQGDVKGFYPSIDQDILHKKLARKIIDDDFMIEADKFIYHAPNGGILLGDPTSVWYGHFYLSDMDHYITQMDGVDHYFRLMDDFVIFGSNKKKVHRAMNEIRRYMYEELHLKLKFNYQVFRMDWIDKDGSHHGRFLDIDGYRFYRDRVTLRKTVMIHATRKVNVIQKRGFATVHDARQMMSHLARMKTCDCYNVFEKYCKGKVYPQRLRKVISNHDRKEREDELERSGGIPAGETIRDGHGVEPDNGLSPEEHPGNTK